MQFTASNNIAIKTKETELIINSAVKVGMNLKRQYLVLAAIIIKRMYLIPVDKIDIPGMQFMLFKLCEERKASVQKNADFQVSVPMGTAGSHLYQKDFQIVHRCMLYNFKFFFFYHVLILPEIIFIPAGYGNSAETSELVAVRVRYPAAHCVGSGFMIHYVKTINNKKNRNIVIFLPAVSDITKIQQLRACGIPVKSANNSAKANFL